MIAGHDREPEAAQEHDAEPFVREGIGPMLGRVAVRQDMGGPARGDAVEHHGDHRDEDIGHSHEDEQRAPEPGDALPEPRQAPTHRGRSGRNFHLVGGARQVSH